MAQHWRPLEICKIIHPLWRSTCIGDAKNEARCSCAVSRDIRMKAIRKLEALGQIPQGSEEVGIRLVEIAGLLLCKRWHQKKAWRIARKWRAAIRNTQLAIPNRMVAVPQSLHDNGIWSYEGRFLGHDPLGTPTFSHSCQSANSRLVSITELEQNSVPFMVSTGRPALIEILRGRESSSIIIRSFRSRTISRIRCNICLDNQSRTRVILTCEECSCDFHLNCLREWLITCPLSAHHTCPHCQRIRIFDGLYIEQWTQADPADNRTPTPPIPGPGGPEYPLLEVVVPSSSRPTSIQLQATINSPEPPQRELRTSERVGRRPDFYVPS
ncbi:hypothetical protein BJY01DRAFT_228030 [Aspergillus pseudoustus]|uniref:RING-type domain-containing protein n=1 Tax=Aspergillus pseudoustus TaxID=1810923 RepID=A0ABR4IQC8_9EURO